MRKIIFICLLLSVAKLATAQKDFKEILDKEDNIYSVLPMFKKYKYEDAGSLFEQVSQRETFVKEKQLWDLFMAEMYNGNFMSEVDEERITKIINKEHQLLFISWYGEKTCLNTTCHIMSNKKLWDLGMDEEALSTYLKPLLKDGVQLRYIVYASMNSYSLEMSRKSFVPKIDYEKELAASLKNAKTDETKALAYRDIARLSHLMGNDVKKTLEWAETSKKLKEDKHTYLLLSAIYAELGAVNE